MQTIERLKATAFLRLFSMWKIPLLAWVRPSIVEMNSTSTEMKIKLSRRTQNHLGVMYFGALAMGAEAAVAVRAVHEIRQSGKRVDFLFKDFQAQFLKRAEGDVHFICDEGEGVRDVIAKTILSGERETKTFRSYAVVPSVSPTEIIAEFKVTLSAKYRPSK